MILNEIVKYSAYRAGYHLVSNKWKLIKSTHSFLLFCWSHAYKQLSKLLMQSFSILPSHSIEEAFQRKMFWINMKRVIMI